MKKQRTLRVDEFIARNLKEPDRYAPDPLEPEPQNEPGDENQSFLYKMSDANLAAAVTFYEREHLFALTKKEKLLAYNEVARATAEVRRRKNKMYSAATEQAFAAEDHSRTVAANDAEANWQRATRKEAA